MSTPTKPISMVAAIGTSAAAVFELGACFVLARQSSLGLLLVMLLAEMILIAAALSQWVAYFRGYIAQQIEERLKKPQNDVSN